MAAIECCCYFYPIKHQAAEAAAAAAAAAAANERRQAAAEQLDLEAGRRESEAAQTGGRVEEIELKCYSLAGNRLLLDTERPFRLVDPSGRIRSRPIRHLDEARDLLDQRRPQSCSLIRLKVDARSGQVEERVSIEEVVGERLDELESAELALGGQSSGSDHSGDHLLKDSLTKSEVSLIQSKRRRQQQQQQQHQHQQQQQQQQHLAKRLSANSFVLVERTSAGPPLDWLTKSDHLQADRSWPSSGGPAAVSVTSQPGRVSEQQAELADLRDQFLSSISVEVAQQQQNQQHQQHQHQHEEDLLKADQTHERTDNSRQARRLTSRLKKSLARKFNRLVASGGGSPAAGRHRVRESNIRYSNLSRQEEQTFNELSSQISDEQYRVGERNGWQLVEHQGEQLPPTAGPLGRGGGSGRPRRLLAMISYNRTEAEDYAKRLHAALERLGVGTYLDLFEIRKGADWQDSLNGAILDCHLFIPLITPTYGETLWTRRELKLADVLGKLIVPINFLRPADWPPKSLAIQFATIQYIWWQSGAVGGPSTAAAAATTNGGHQVKRANEWAGEWPTACVESIAGQLRQTIELDLLDELKMIEGEGEADDDQHMERPPDSLQSSASSTSSSSSSGVLSSTTSSCTSSSSSSSAASSYSSTTSSLPERAARHQLDSGYDSPETTGLLVARKSVRLPLLELAGQTDAKLVQSMLAANHNHKHNNSNNYGSLPDSGAHSQPSSPAIEAARSASLVSGRHSKHLQAEAKKGRRKNSISGRALSALTKIRRTFKPK